MTQNPIHRGLTQCYVDESIHEKLGFVVTAFIFASGRFDSKIATVIKEAGLTPYVDEYKSSARMDRNPQMRAARDGLLSFAGSNAKIAVYIGPYGSMNFERSALGKHTLQALQSTLVRNGITPARLRVYFDNDLFKSTKEGSRLLNLFHYLKPCSMYFEENSHFRMGIQVADAVANSFAQILKENLTGKEKIIDIGGEHSGYEKGTMVPLGWQLLMSLRHGLLTRPMVYDGSLYTPSTDP